MSTQSDIALIRSVVAGLDANRLARFSYTDAAFSADTVAGVDTFDVNAEQNVPKLTKTDYADKVLDKGLRTQGASVPRNAMNHFFGRTSYNLNKLVSKLLGFIDATSASIAHNAGEYDANAAYKAGDMCYLLSGTSPLLTYTLYERVSASPAAITGIAPGDANHWREVMYKGTGFHHKYTVADLTSGYDTAKWYPVVTGLQDFEAKIGDTKDPALRVAIEAFCNGTVSGYTNAQRAELSVLSKFTGFDASSTDIVLDYSCVDQVTGSDSAGSASAPIGYSKLVKGRQAVMWLRGGSKYALWNGFGASFTLYTSSYSNGLDTAIAPVSSVPMSVTNAQVQADLVGKFNGIDVARFIFGSNEYGYTSGVTDADSITKSGFYSLGNTAQHIPTAAYYSIMHMQYDATAAIQIAVSTSLASYIRKKNGGAWDTSWTELWNASNDGSGSGLDADLVRGVTPGTGGLALLALSALGTNWSTALAAALGTQAKTYLTKDTQATMAAQILTDLNSRNVVGFNNQVATNVSLSGVHWGPRLTKAGNGYYIAYGDGVLLSADGADVTRSTDKGITWASTSAPFSGSVVRCVCYGGGVWVAVATGGKIARSISGGATWSTLITNPFSGTDIYAVAYGNGVWLAAGASGKLARSTDGGATWGSLVLSSFGGASITSLAYGNGTFVAVSANGDAAYSVNGGATWSATLSTGLDTSNVSLFTRVSYGNGVFIAVGRLGSIARSTDGGASWSRCGTVGSSGMNGAAYGNGTWVVVSTDGYVTRSIDNGVTWSERIKNGMYALYDVYSVAYAGNLWVAAGTSSVTRSEIEQWALP